MEIKSQTELRMTGNRQVVLEVLRNTTAHPTAQQVFLSAREQQPGIGFATVYRALHALVDADLALELDLGDAAARYDANTHPHDHVVCEACGRAADLAPVLPRRALDQVAAATGYEVTGYSLTFRGRCAACLPEKGTP